MRTIKFRGKRVDNGKWIYGNLVYMHGFGGTWTTGIQMQSGDGYRAWASISVDPETVGEYTGMQDKDKNEIYENDIVMDSKGRYGSVFWNAEDCQFQVDFYEEMEVEDIDSSYMVCGNTFENLDLLGIIPTESSQP